MSDILTTVVGRLTNEPVIRDLGAGREVVSFRMACNHGFYDRQTGAWKESSTSYLSVDVWRRHLGRNVKQTFAKGDPVIVHGRLYVREFEQEGRPRTAVSLVAEAVGPDLNTATAVVNRVRRAADGSLLDDGTPLSDGPRGPGTRAEHPSMDVRDGAPLEPGDPVSEVAGAPVGRT
ncbi:single-stranded DNA-binding protein [Pseudonocardia oroxyli]|uniref:Single-stranded DNA-binding protein n=1 Tax=Pseudonocardia oroxyli TaxID=366584 RepID=A0A1G7KPH6_PSEOR|nr:single-stranded DNA-binding protein [Pseudonocardia oroxyli]SDF39026.1 single-strand DNA-binding protein [Pseudonocardia oroxyli]